ncbi:hypothetical protein C8F04DRAFT_1232554 [Mycena alexandri]|uniref:Uncharacterized protein n=1 Tax=Mycena alexandri TaxID=1745969 RepID=A0AAD6X6L6_9AGAR|nr:hypothetical protein C8F04DRAFT_1232554 [Mycena alexandri]
MSSLAFLRKASTQKVPTLWVASFSPAQSPTIICPSSLPACGQSVTVRFWNGDAPMRPRASRRMNSDTPVRPRYFPRMLRSVTEAALPRRQQLRTAEALSMTKKSVAVEKVTLKIDAQAQGKPLEAVVDLEVNPNRRRMGDFLVEFSGQKSLRKPWQHWSWSTDVFRGDISTSRYYCVNTGP